MLVRLAKEIADTLGLNYAHEYLPNGFVEARGRKGRPMRIPRWRRQWLKEHAQIARMRAGHGTR